MGGDEPTLYGNIFRSHYIVYGVRVVNLGWFSIPLSGIVCSALRGYAECGNSDSKYAFKAIAT